MDDPVNTNAVLSLAQSQPDQAGNETAGLRAQTLASLREVTVQPGPLLTLLNGPNNPDVVVKTLESCPILAARVLAVTNSAGVGVAHPIQSLQRAVIHLGAARTRSLALAYALKLVSEQINLDAQRLDALWSSSLCKAAAARLAADQIDPHHSQSVYAMALIQDIGLPMLMAVDPVFYDRLSPTSDHGWCQQEKAHFGIDHAEVGAHVLHQWAMSPSICRSVQQHHRPPTDADAAKALTELPGFVASLLPHLHESMTGMQRQWLLTLHAKFFVSSYENAGAFIRAACDAASPLLAGQGPRQAILRALTQRLPEAVAGDSAQLVEQLCRLERALGRERKATEALRYESLTDPLTRVLNRRGFTELAQERLEDARHHQLGVCCMVLDLDAFKQINDQFGHDVGDAVLQRLVSVLRHNIKRTDLICRLGGDEFVVLIDVHEQEEARRFVERLCRACHDGRIEVDDSRHVSMSVSIGAAFCPRIDSTVQLQDLVAAADAAMYQRKRDTKSGMLFTQFNSDTEQLGVPRPSDESNPVKLGRSV